MGPATGSNAMSKEVRRPKWGRNRSRAIAPFPQAYNQSPRSMGTGQKARENHQVKDHRRREEDDFDILQLIACPKAREEQELKLREKERRYRVGTESVIGRADEKIRQTSEDMLDISHRSNESFCILSLLQQRQCAATATNEICKLDEKHQQFRQETDLEEARTTGTEDAEKTLHPAGLRQARDTPGVVQANPGAYNGSFGELYQRQCKIENCGQILRRQEEYCTQGDTNRGSGNGAIILEATLLDSKWWLQKPIVIAGVIILFLLVFFIAVPATVLPMHASKDPTFKGENPLAGTIAPKHEIDLPLVPNMSNATLQAIVQEDTSPQALAYEWISKDPNWESYEGWRKQQRFVLSCLFYSFFTTLRREAQPRYDSHECSWIEITRGGTKNTCRVNDQGRVNYLGIGSSPNYDSSMIGTLPHELALLSSLEVLYLDGVNNVGYIEEALPLEAFGSMPNFQELYLHDCELTGSIPSTLGLLSHLTTLDLRGNSLTGTVPKEIGELPSLQVFAIEDNPGVEGPLPLEFCTNAQKKSWVTLETDWCLGPEDCCETV